MKFTGVFLIFVLASIAQSGVYAFAQQEQAASASVTIGEYKEESFAPSRDEIFTIPIKIDQQADIQKLAIEIHTADDDLVTTLNLSNIEKGKTDYELKWDGKDNQKLLVPDEAYIPILLATDSKGTVTSIDPRSNSGGEEMFDFDKTIGTGTIEYKLPKASRMLIRSGIKNGPMLRTIIDWQPRSSGFHAERWNGYDLDNVIAIEQSHHASYLIIGYRLPDHTIITFGNEQMDYRQYRKEKGWPLPDYGYTDQSLEREGKLLRREFYTPVLKQKSPRISVTMLDKDSDKPASHIQGMDEVLTLVGIDQVDEIYLDQDRYEISFFVDNTFIAEEEQGFVPFTWRWSPGRYGIKPGKHVLTVNISGYTGQVGVKNLAFTLKEEASGKKP
jgi:hypothetical protein